MKKPTNLFKRAAIAVMAASIVAATPTVASAAWETTGKGWNWIVNGQKATGWQWIDSQWYFMDSTGTMKTGWVQEGGSWYYLAPSGAMATGWTMADGTWYYLKSSGAMATGWVNDNGSWYRMNTSGAMITGWTSWNGGWYYMAPGGDMVTGVIKVDGATYAMDATGKMQTGEVTIEGKTYTFGEDGAAVGEAPAATRTFSGAAETTNTGTGTGGTTTPSKPNRPSYGGGGSSTPDPDPNPNPGPGPVDPSAGPLTINQTKYGELTDEEKAKTYSIVTVEAWTDEINLSWLKADTVIIKEAPNAAALRTVTEPTVTVSNNVNKVIVQIQATIASSTALADVTINVAKAATVTVNADVTALTVAATDATAATTLAGSGTITGLTANTETIIGTATTTVTANADVTVGATVETVKVTAAATVDTTGGTITTIDVGAATTITGTGTITTVEAKAPTIVENGTVSTINATDSVTVTGGTISGNINVTAAENKTVNVSLKEGTFTDGAVKITSDSKGTVKAEKVSSDGQTTTPITPGKIQAKPVEGTDYEVVTADETNPAPEGGIKLAAKADGKLEYISGKGTDWTGKQDLPTAGIKVAGTYQIRVKGDDTASPAIDPSEPVEVTIDTFTGWAKDDKHYEASVVSENKWVIKAAGTVECYVGKGGAVTVTFTKDNCKVTDGVFADGITETTEGTAKLVIATGSAAGTVGADFDYKTAEAGTYTVQVAVGTAKSTLTATITKEAAKPEAPAVPAGTSTEAGKIVITGYNADAGLEYKLYKGENAETATLVSDAKHTNGTYTGLEAGKYYLTASKDGAESAKSAVIDVKGSTTTPDAPAAPAGTSPEAGKIVITDYNADAGLEYKLYKGESAETATAVDKTHTDGTYTGLEAGKYYLTASKDGVESAKSEVIEVKGSTTTPEAPAAPAGTSPEAGKIVITGYNADAGLVYKLYKGESAETATAVDKTHTDGTYTGLEAGKYYLTASKDGVESAKSEVIEVKEATSETPAQTE